MTAVIKTKADVNKWDGKTAWEIGIEPKLGEDDLPEFTNKQIATIENLKKAMAERWRSLEGAK